jgi:hypothetical protein
MTCMMRYCAHMPMICHRSHMHVHLLPPSTMPHMPWYNVGTRGQGRCWHGVCYSMGHARGPGRVRARGGPPMYAHHKGIDALKRRATNFQGESTRICGGINYTRRGWSTRPRSPLLEAPWSSQAPSMIPARGSGKGKRKRGPGRLPPPTWLPARRESERTAK